jgi:carbon starvation protein
LGNTLYVIIFAIIAVFVGYNWYARRIDRGVIQPDPNKATPARMYMDGVDFMPTNRNVLYGYHFKSIAAAGPIVGPITAAPLWGWVPSLLWLVFGVMLIGWASDYSAIAVSVRNEGNSLSAIAHQLIAPRTRRILLLFIFFYLLLIAGAFANLITGVLVDPRVPLGIIALAVFAFVGGQLLYRAKLDLVLVTLITVGGTLACILLNAGVGGIQNAIKSFDGGLTSIAPNIVTVLNPLAPANAQNVTLSLNYVFWLLFLFLFCYFGAILPIWRYTQPVNYIGFWITALTIFFGGVGAALAFFIKPEVSSFKLPSFIGFGGPASLAASGAIQPLWPMLFVTIACGAISGWHALIGSVGTSRQIESETDMLPVGGGAMFSEFTLGILSLMAVSVAAQPTGGAPQFAAGVGNFLSVFGIPAALGTGIGFAAFVVVVITFMQLLYRVMRVTLTEGLGDASPIFRNVHVTTLINMALTFILVMSGTFIYIFQLFGAANQLMASLSLMIVTVWLASTKRNPVYAGIPAVFMYVTTMAATLVTVYNLFKTVAVKPGAAGIAVAGSWITIIIGLIIFLAAIVIGIDGFRAFQRHLGPPSEMAPAPAPAPA